MKVFISYSSVEAWIARKIAEDIEALGISVFLDTKSIETGDDFDQSIRDEIANADEMIVLISPSALKSLWVTMEFGAARVLNKRLVPILINVAPNELPQPLNRHLSRDLNQIERYYDELRQRRDSGESASVPVVLPTPAPDRSQTIMIGDRVTISASPRDPDDYPVLSAEMQKYLGISGTVIAYGAPEDDPPTFRLDVDGGNYYWAERWLERAD